MPRTKIEIPTSHGGTGKRRQSICLEVDPDTGMVTVSGAFNQVRSVFWTHEDTDGQAIFCNHNFPCGERVWIDTELMGNGTIAIHPGRDENVLFNYLSAGMTIGFDNSPPDAHAEDLVIRVSGIGKNGKVFTRKLFQGPRYAPKAPKQKVA